MPESDRALFNPTDEEFARGFGAITPRHQSQADIDIANAGCLSCHSPTDSNTMHAPELRVLVSCVDCHGGNGDIRWTGQPLMAGNSDAQSADYLAAKQSAHGIEPRYKVAWSDPITGRRSSANPVRSGTLFNYEDPRFIRFVNPGDLRVAHVACGQCHMDIVQRMRTSMMTHGAQLWGAALYNNGSYPHKLPRYGESYSVGGSPQRMYSQRPSTPHGSSERNSPVIYRRYSPSAAERGRGVIEYLDPLPRWEITQMGNILRAFERGGKQQRLEVELGQPNPKEDPGRPDMKLSDRGLGTQLSTDPVFLNLQKTRLLDPILSFPGTNDHAGDFRASGCTSCHSIYANDRSAVHSAGYAVAGNLGLSRSTDPTIPRNEPGHPIAHIMTRGIPSSQCIVCHMHPGTSFANAYLGFTWWDNETHGELMYPAQSARPTAEQVVNSLMANPEAASLRGLWSNLYPSATSHSGTAAGDDFLSHSAERLNPRMNRAQFADFHGHGWMFRAVFKQDRKGRLLDSADKPVAAVSPDKLQKAVAFTAKRRGDRMPADHPVHLKDIHLERGMHCVDCHFEQDVHGDGKLYGEVRNAIEVDCIDCHGTIRQKATLYSSGPAGGNDLAASQTPFGRRFDWREGRLHQRSSVQPGVEWVVPQIIDSVTPSSGQYNARAARAKLMQRGGGDAWNDNQCPESKLAHGNDSMTCYACHTAWMTSCFGCHLPMRANMRMPMLHNEGELLRNFTSYNFQVIRDDVFMLGKDSTVKGHRVAPVRSSSAVVVGSANANREWSYSQQQTVSSEGYAGQAFNPHFPHAVRATESRKCTDCHLSESNDNNAWLAQVLLQGTNFVNFLGRFAYVAQGSHGFEAVVVTEREEPQAVIGSTLHALAYPEAHGKHAAHGSKLTESHEHGLNDGPFPGGGEILDCQLRGEYLYTARGRDGFYAYDVANIDNKGFSERLITAPVSPIGQYLGVRTRYATSVASPSTLAVDPTRTRVSSAALMPRAGIMDALRGDHVNQEQPIHPVYAFVYVTDREEGLLVVGDKRTGVGTLLDGDPTNNFLKRALAFNPDGKLTGAVHAVIAGHFAYVCCDRGLAVVDLNDPLNPVLVAEVGAPAINAARAVAIQFRYAFVTDADGLKVIDITWPTMPRAIPTAALKLADARRLYVARTYAYIACGADGLAIVDVENPEQPRLDQHFTADGALNDTRDVKVGMTNNSAFAYVADGRNGLRVLQLTSPADMQDAGGFSPRPQPRLIATHATGGPALAVSKGLDRDRAVDESGHQTAVFGRIGARPFTREEQLRLYSRTAPGGKPVLYRVRD